MSTKIIITNLTALKSKYGSNFRKVQDAVKNLIDTDKTRGISTRLVAVDSAADMKANKGKAVKSAKSQAQVKAAIDAVYTACVPDYLLLLGGPEIIPFQKLKNPCVGPDGDDDSSVPSDLPYACSAPYARDASKFLGPTRVVGRLPDIPGDANPSFLLKLLDVASGWKAETREQYKSYLGISAEVWKESTGLSISKLFGSSKDMKTVPPKGPKWTDPYLARRIHFINCHGASSDPTFYGQRGEEYPEAHKATLLPGKITKGTVAAAECCYGGQVYDPSDSDGQAGICLTYLKNGAYGFLGSSTIAYGPSSGNGQADLLCQYFIEMVLGGASLGRALLEARQRFASGYTHFDPSDLKTMAQFYLLGDPSIQAVLPQQHMLSTTKAYKEAFAKSKSGTLALRREKLAFAGMTISSSLGFAQESSRVRTPKSVLETLEKAARESGVRRYAIKSYKVLYPALRGSVEARFFAKQRKSRTIHMLAGKRKGPDGVPHIVSISATVENGKLIHLRRVHSR
jgi:hypothetical protein